MKITIIHASRSRPQLAEATARLWLDMADSPDEIEYILCIDLSDPKGRDYKDYFGDKRFIKCIRDNKSAIQAINEGAKMATGDIFIIVSDDFNEPPLHWDTLLLQEIGDRTDICVKTQDGIQPFIITLPILTRDYYNRFGYVYAPEFSHMYSDSQMSCVAWMTGCYLKVDLLIKHNHYTTGKSKKDNVNVKANSTYFSGREIFRRNYKKNFGLKPEEIKQELPEWSGFKNFK